MSMQLLDAADLEPTEIADGRRHERYAFSSRIELFWCEANGSARCATGSGVNVSIYGMLVETSVFLAPGTEVVVTVDAVQISSKARVRHCRNVLGFFRIGLRFDTILVAEHVESLDSVLIKSFRTGTDHIEQIQHPVHSTNQNSPLAAGKNRRLWWRLSSPDQKA